MKITVREDRKVESLENPPIEMTLIGLMVSRLVEEAGMGATSDLDFVAI